MATTYTSNLRLTKQAQSDRNWHTALNANSDTLDAISTIGGLAVTLAEVPSATLNVNIAAGSFLSTTGAVVTYAGTTNYALTTATTQLLWLTNAGALATGTSWPSSGTPHVRLASVVVGASTITSITDARVVATVTTYGGFLLLSGGTLTDGANVVLGSTTGTKIGTATTQKLGFFNKTPIVQPTGGAATAGGTYTATEQAMLQNAYNALRNLGLLS